MQQPIAHKGSQHKEWVEASKQQASKEKQIHAGEARFSVVRTMAVHSIAVAGSFCSCAANHGETGGGVRYSCERVLN
jgi:hypothetical protein